MSKKKTMLIILIITGAVIQILGTICLGKESTNNQTNTLLDNFNKGEGKITSRFDQSDSNQRHIISILENYLLQKEGDTLSEQLFLETLNISKENIQGLAQEIIENSISSYSKGIAYMVNKDFKKAIESLEEASENEIDKSFRIKILYNLSKSWRNLNRTDNIEKAKKYLVLAEKSYNDLKIKSIDDEYYCAMILNELGILKLNEFESDSKEKGVEYLEKALQIDEKLAGLDKFKRGLSSTLVNLAIGYRQIEDFESAKEKALEAIMIDKLLWKTNKTHNYYFALGGSYLNYASILREEITKEIRDAENTNDDHQIKKANESSLVIEVKNEAVWYFEESLKLTQEAIDAITDGNSDFHKTYIRQKSMIYQHWGQLLSIMRDFPEAEKKLLKSEMIIVDLTISYPNESQLIYDLALAKIKLSELYLRIGWKDSNYDVRMVNKEKAINYYQEAIELYPSFKEELNNYEEQMRNMR